MFLVWESVVNFRIDMGQITICTELYRLSSTKHECYLSAYKYFFAEGVQADATYSFIFLLID